RPILLGPIVGLLLGDLKTGLVMGGTLELAFMGVVEIGGGVNQNKAIGSVLGTAFAISAGLSIEAALLIAIPASIIGSFFELLAKTFSTFFVAQAEAYADKNSTKGFSAMVHLGNAFHFLAIAIPTFLALALGTTAIESFANAIPPWLNSGIKVVGSVLPAFGFALLLNTIATTQLMPFFFIGFVLAAYLKFDVLGAAFVGALIAAIFVFRQGGINLINKEGVDQHVSLVPKSYQKQIYWRSFALQSAFSFDRMQALGFTWGLLPWLKKLYGETPELGKAMRRHTTFFNTHPWVAGPIYALVADMEARRAQDVNSVDESSIQALKGSLMGPLAGIGDPLFHGTARPLLAGVSASLALVGNPIAPILFFGVMLALHLYASKVTLDFGFRMGSTLFERLDAESLSRLMEAVSMAGLVAIGSLVGTWVSISTPLKYVSPEGVELAIQGVLDSIFPKMLPLIVTLILFYFARKGISANVIMLVSVVVALLLGALKILG
ncbi:MAG: PTS system mannose/fructose/sorbose family transporter subunit IID, partial [Anaerolineaceae bacterium]|nr:PTS system mannose/fructose/sorbose family transporter subunit IID [Anaerolineaceae bacterium]